MEIYLLNALYNTNNNINITTVTTSVLYGLH